MEEKKNSFKWLKKKKELLYASKTFTYIHRTKLRLFKNTAFRS